MITSVHVSAMTENVHLEHGLTKITANVNALLNNAVQMVIGIKINVNVSAKILPAINTKNSITTTANANAQIDPHVSLARCGCKRSADACVCLGPTEILNVIDL